jgi:hypothetical protein
VNTQARLILRPAAVLVIASLACNLGGSPGSSTTTGMDGSALESKIVQLDSTGGQFQVGDADLVFESPGLQTPSNLTLELHAAPAAADSEAGPGSDIYSVSGLPADFQGTVQVTMPIPDGILNALDGNDPDRAQRISLLMGTAEYAPSDRGFLFVERPMEARVDLSAGKAAARIDLTDLQARGPMPKMAAPARQFGAWLSTENDFYFRMQYHQDGESKAESGNFEVAFPSSIGSAAIAPLVDALEWNKSQLEEIGFNFGPFGPERRFPVRVYDCDTREGTFGLYGDTVKCDGKFTFPWYGRSLTSSHLVINTRLLGDGQKLKAVVGHELMHYMQFVTYFDRLDTAFRAYTMLDEAVAMWYESVAVGDPEYIPDFALTNDDFIKLPWFFADPEKTQDMGYGASWFIRYLVDTYDSDVVYKAYAGGYATGELALGISVVENADTILGEAFRRFLPLYLVETDELCPGLGEEADFQRLRTASVKLMSSEESDIILTFKTTMNGVTFNNGEVLPDETLDPEPTATITKTIGGMNGEMFSFTADPANPLLLKPGQLSVQVSTSESRSGVLIYGLTDKGDYGTAELLTGGEDYLSSDGKTAMTVPDFSAPGGEGEYEQIVFLPFNMEDNENRPSTITITLTYRPAKAASLGGVFFAEEWKYPADVCDLKPSDGTGRCEITATTEPPACMGDLTGGGGGGGGDGGEVAAQLPACLPRPGWCWQCGAQQGGWMFVDKYSLNGDDPDIFVKFKMDEKGIVTAITSREFSRVDDSGGITYLAPTVLTHDGSAIHAEWPDLEDYFENVGYFKLDGTITSAGGSGTWVLGHPGPGDTVSGRWTAETCEAVSLNYGRVCGE